MQISNFLVKSNSYVEINEHPYLVEAMNDTKILIDDDELIVTKTVTKSIGKMTDSKYTSIGKIEIDLPNFNVCGMVWDYTPVTTTKISQSSIRITLKDESGMIEFTQYANDASKIIVPGYIGQILCLTNVCAKEYRGHLQIFSASQGFNFSLHNDDSTVQEVQQIKGWAREYLENNSFVNQYHSTISKISKENSSRSIDVIVKVLKIDLLNGVWKIQITDGTESPMLGATPELSCQADYFLAPFVKKLSELISKESIFIKCRNIKCGYYGCLEPHSHSSIHRLPNYCQDAARLSITKSIVISPPLFEDSMVEEHIVPEPRIERVEKLATKVVHDKAPLSTIEEVLKSERLTWKFRVCARISEFHPSNRRLVHEVCKACKGTMSKGKCILCKSSNSVYVRCAKLCLEDSTGKLIAYLYDSEFVFHPSY